MPFPTINACIVCDLARAEVGNKFALLGYYGLTPGVRVSIQNFAQPVQLCFVFAAGPGSGHFRIGLRITAPDGRSFDAPEVQGDLRAEFPISNFFMSFLGILPGPGEYRATLMVNGVPNFQTTFGLTQVPPPAPPN